MIGLYVSFSRTKVGLCMYKLFVWSNLNLGHNFQWTTLSIQPCQVLYFFCANLLHSLITWLMVSSLFPHNLHLLFCCVLSILAWIWLVLRALFSAAIRRVSVSLLRFLFLSQVHVFSCKMLFNSRIKRPLSCFSSHFVGPHVVSIVSGACNQSSSALFSAVFKSFCIDASTLLLLAGFFLVSNWWVFAIVWVTSSLLSSPGHF